MGSVLEVKAENWEPDVLKSESLVLVDFWHDHCPWCIKLNPVIDEVSEEYQDKIRFAKLNVLESLDNQRIAVRYGVMGTPTLKFFCSGRPVHEIVGFISIENLKKALDEMLTKHRECIQQSTEMQSE